MRALGRGAGRGVLLVALWAFILVVSPLLAQAAAAQAPCSAGESHGGAGPFPCHPGAPTAPCPSPSCPGGGAALTPAPPLCPQPAVSRPWRVGVVFLLPLAVFLCWHPPA